MKLKKKWDNVQRRSKTSKNQYPESWDGIILEPSPVFGFSPEFILDKIQYPDKKRTCNMRSKRLPTKHLRNWVLHTPWKNVWGVKWKLSEMFYDKLHK